LVWINPSEFGLESSFISYSLSKVFKELITIDRQIKR